MEKEQIKDLILRYGVLLGKRHTEKQKTAFLRAAKKQMELAGFPVDITCVSTPVMKRQHMRLYNLYAGDFQHADIVCITYYDTPLRSFLSKEQKVFHSNWSRANYLLHMLLLLVCVVLIVLLLYGGVLPNLRQHGFVSVWGVVLIVLCMGSFFMMKHMREGIANRNNLVRNSSSLIALFALASRLSKPEKQRIAFAFLDEGTRSEYGLQMLDSYIGKRKMKRLYVDAIANGEDLQCFHDLDIAPWEHVEQHRRETGMARYGDVLLTSGVYTPSGITIDPASSLSKEDIAFKTENLYKLMICLLQRNNK